MKTQALFNVEGLVTIVTGGASGIGYGLAEAMAENGALVALLDNNAEALVRAVDTLRMVAGEVKNVSGELANVTDKAQIARAFDDVAARHGRIDVVFANAGISGGPGFLDTKNERSETRFFETLSPELWDRVIAANLTSVFKTIQVAVPHLKRSGGGRIIVTSSVSAMKTENYVSAIYVASKAGVAQLVRQAAIELAAYNIQVNAIAPGPCITNIGGGRLHDKAAQDFFARLHPNHRMATPEDMQGAALYLASPAARHVNGAHIVVDGGFSLGTAD